MIYIITLLLLITPLEIPFFHDNGIVKIKSSYTVSDTADNLVAELDNKGMKIFARINHSEGAKAIGKKLRPTELVIFGNPNVGTPLMQCSQTMALDLPQKALIWEDEKGDVWLSYNDPKYLADRHHIEGCKDVIAKVRNALANFAKAATGNP